MVKTSAGIAIIYKHKILLAHPTRGSWKNRFTPPKGGIEENEEIIDAAVRETFEEIGIKVDKTKLKDFVIIPYKNPRGAVYKRVYLFPLYISNLSEINLESEIVPKEQLQLEEVDYAAFYSVNEYKDLVLPRYNEYLDQLLNLDNE